MNNTTVTKALMNLYSMSEEEAKNQDINMYELDSTSFKSEWEQLAEELIEEGYLGEIPEHLINYIDAEAYGRDLMCSGSFDYVEDGNFMMEVMW